VLACDGPQEPRDEATHADPKWPSSGDIEFNNYKMRYREGSPPFILLSLLLLANDD
jgi:hypothetical protein